MLRKRWFRWLIPGLNIKRWLALFSVGVGLLIVGISLMFNYQWLAVLEDIVLAFSYDLTGFYCSHCCRACTIVYRCYIDAHRYE